MNTMIQYLIMGLQHFGRCRLQANQFSRYGVLHVLQELLLTNLTTLSSMSPTAGYWPEPDFQ